MNELPVFISYRQADGGDLARALYRSLLGRSLSVWTGSLHVVVTITPLLDRVDGAGSHSQAQIMANLGRARALIVVCTPGAVHEFTDEADWLYAELRWWLANRSHLAPVLVAFRQHGLRWIPPPIAKQWPEAHVVMLSAEALREPLLLSELEIAVDGVLAGIVQSAESDVPHIQSGPWSTVGMTSLPGLYTWAKDRYFRYTDANDNYARAAGYDSPQAMIGKTDDDMPWRTLAEFFRAGDYQVMMGTGAPRERVPEKEIMVDRVADIVVTEAPQYSGGSGSRVIGLVGCFIDMADYAGQQAVRPNPAGIESRFPLGKEFGDEYLTAAEVLVFRGLVRSLPPDHIATLLGTSHHAVDQAILEIKRKFQCQTTNEVVVVAVKAGLPLALFGPSIEGSDA